MTERSRGATTSPVQKPPGNISPQKWARLVAFLEMLPTSAAEKLFAAIDLDRVRPTGAAAGGLPHGALLDAIRPLLAERGARFPARAPTAQRLFFTPIEDFLIAARRGRKRQARIPRSSLAPLWRVLMTDPACSEAARLSIKLDQAIIDDLPRDQINDLETELFAAAAHGYSTIIAHASDDEAYRADLVRRLGGDQEGAAASHDLAEIAQVLPVAAFLKEVQRVLPRPIAALTEEDLFEVRRIYAAASAEHPDHAAYVLLCVAGRMEAPWRAMRVYYHLSVAHDASMASVGEDAHKIVEMIFDDLEGMARLLERDSEDAFDADDTALRLSHFAAFATGVIEEARLANDGAVVNRAEASRDLAAAALQRFCEQALSAVRRAQPTRHAGGSSHLKALRPDIDRKLDPMTVDAARAAADFLSSAETSAAKLNRPDVASALVAETKDYARRYAGDVVLEIRAAEGEERKQARVLMETAIDLARRFLPPSEIALLKDKAAAAAVSA